MVLAPLYDVAPIALDYDGSNWLAMRVNEVTDVNGITRQDLVMEGQKWGLTKSRADAVVQETLTALETALHEVEVNQLIADRVPGYIGTRTANLLNGAAAISQGGMPMSLRSTIPLPERTSGVD